MGYIHICAWLLLLSTLSTTLRAAAAAAAAQQDDANSQATGASDGVTQTAYTGYGSYVSVAADDGHMDSHHHHKHSHRHEPHGHHDRHVQVSQHMHRQHSNRGPGTPLTDLVQEVSNSQRPAMLVQEGFHSQGPAMLDKQTSAEPSTHPPQQPPQQQGEQQNQQLDHRQQQLEQQQWRLEQEAQHLAQILQQQRQQLEQQQQQLQKQQQQLDEQQQQLEKQQQQLEQRVQQQVPASHEQSQTGSSGGPSTELKVPQGSSSIPSAPGDAPQTKGLTGSSQQQGQQLQPQLPQQQQQQQQQKPLEAPNKPSTAADVPKPSPHSPESANEVPASPGAKDQGPQPPVSSDKAPAKKRAPDFDDPSTWPDPVEDATKEYADGEPGSDSANGTQPVRKPPGGYWPYYGQFVPDLDADLPEFPGGAAPGAERRFGEPAPGDYGSERKFGDPAPGDYKQIRKLPRALNVTGGDCKADGLLAPAQGSGVVIDDSATVADGVVTAIADCVEAPGTTFQKGGHCELVCTDESDYKVVQKTLEKLVRTGVDGQVRCEAKRVTDSISIKGICSLIPVAECCEAENPDEEYIFEQQAEKREYADYVKP